MPNASLSQKAASILVAVASLFAVVAVTAGPAQAATTEEVPPEGGSAPVLGAGDPWGPIDVGQAAATTPDVFAFGDAPFLGSTGDLDLVQRMVAMAATRTGGGYWMAGRDGGVFAFGDAGFYGSTGDLRLNQPVVGMAATPSGAGYWLVASDGGIFAFGDAAFYGSTGSMHLNQPVVGMAATPSGAGYWLVASDGGIFSFGDAAFYGSTGDIRLNQPVVGMASTPVGAGYWMVARDGGVFCFGDAPFAGSGAGTPGDVVGNVVGLAPSPTGAGYRIAAADGSVQGFGDAPALGGTDPVALGPGRVAAIASTPSGAGYWLAAGRVGDTVAVYQPRGLDAANGRAILRVAAAAGGTGTILHSGTLGLSAVWRGTTPVQLPPPGMRYPMASVAIDPAAAAVLMGPAVARSLAAGDVVMGATSAGLRGAVAGDSVDILGWDGVTRRLRIGFVAPDGLVGSSELVLSLTTAAGMGFVRPSQVTIWDVRTHADVDAALAAGLPPVLLGISKSWELPDIDDTLSSAHLKAIFGEFAYASGSGDSIVQDDAWRAANLRTESVPILGNVTCHRLMIPALRGALTEIQAAGLAGAIDAVDSRNGGCYYAREIRGGGGTTGGAISRHSWGLAIDINPSSNAFGTAGHMDPRVVEIFRRWGFVWGGGWVLRDPMHFEMVRPG